MRFVPPNYRATSKLHGIITQNTILFIKPYDGLGKYILWPHITNRWSQECGIEFGDKGKGKSIPVTGRGSPWDCETSRLPHFLENMLTAVRSALRAGRPLPPGRILVLISVRG
jgi:hypothetical protein